MLLLCLCSDTLYPIPTNKFINAPKIHINMSIAHWKPILKSRGRNRKVRSKSFKSVELADAWAKAHNVAKYNLIDLKPNSLNKKIKIEYTE